MVKRTLKCMLAVALTVAALAGPIRQAQAADLAFPILIVPVWSQNEPVAGAFTDTRITIQQLSDGGAAAGSHAAVFDVLGFLFDHNERLVASIDIPMSQFDVFVLTEATGLPAGPTTGTAILINTTAAGGGGPVLSFGPIAAVVQIGAKVAAGSILDPVGPAGPGGLASVIASEAQVIPAVAGAFPRVEITLAAGPAAVFFPAGGFETIIAETCLFSGAIRNFILNHNENFLFSREFFCSGLDSAPPAGSPFAGPDLVLWTPDDGNLLAPPPPAGPAIVIGMVAGYNALAVDVNTFGGFIGPFGETLIYGQAGVFLPDGADGREAYSYNMPANYFGSRFDAITTAEVGATLVEALGTQTDMVLEMVDGVCTALSAQVTCQ